MKTSYKRLIFLFKVENAQSIRFFVIRTMIYNESFITERKR
ncbi:hypothetical protein LEP1GSC029_4594 [Leptospira interrogans str. 2002000626]|uniref:Uncharacterized protein n=2 Tax=Leptospira interrogans TaxID=173 RepID=A0A829D6J9_LEPIR|nr:hypothetical protein LEP1GSC029_4594 [Leptospira interrogans str. 2002000626]EMY23399.1 hypothetical protein LEP1GSC115_3589 [Leptospira interrogans serovar Australis str. 200703203]